MAVDIETKLETPRFGQGRPMRIVGMRMRCAPDSNAGIPELWQRFAPAYMGKISGQVGWTSYGVVLPDQNGGGTDYLCGVEVRDGSPIPAELTTLELTERRYAVFTHGGHVSGLRGTWMAIFDRWLPVSGLKVGEAPAFERYADEFDPQTGFGGMEIWIPIER